MDPGSDTASPTVRAVAAPKGLWPRSRVGNWLALGWMAVVVVYYLGRYDGWLAPVQAAGLLWQSLPTLRVGPHFGAFIAGRLLDFGVLSLLGAVAFGVGAVGVASLISRNRAPCDGERELYPVLRGLPRATGGIAALFALALGLWLVAVMVLVIGAVSVQWVPLIGLAGLTWLAPAPRQLLRGCRWRRPELDNWEWVVLGVLLVAMLLTLVGATTPPFEYDELEYHLGAPADYLRAGRIVFLPGNFYSNLPQLTEMLYLPALVLRSGIAAKLLHWGFGVLTALVIVGIGSRLWSRRVGLWAAVLFYGVPFVQDLSQTARIDLATTFYASLAFGGLLLWRETDRAEWRILAALAAGGAVATKWTAIPVVLLPLLLFVAVSSRSIRTTVVCGGLGLIPCAPWLVKNIVLAGNPVYPLLARLFPSPHWSAEQTALFAQKHYAVFGPGSWHQVLDLAWHYSLREPLAVPLYLMTAPVLVFTWGGAPNQVATRRAVGLFTAGYLGWFLLTFRPWRFLFPVLPVAALLGAVALESFADRLPRRLAGLFVGLVLASSLAVMGSLLLWDVAENQRGPAPLSVMQYALGQVTAGEFLARLGYGVYEPVLWMNDHLPPRTKVLYVGEARTYYARHQPVGSTAYDQHPLTAWMQSVRTSAELAATLRAHGIRYIYVNASEWQRLEEGYGYLRHINRAVLVDCLQRYADRIHTHGASIVFELAPRS